MEKEGHSGSAGSRLVMHSLQSLPDRHHFHLTSSNWSHVNLLPNQATIPKLQDSQISLSLLQNIWRKKILEDTPVTANDITEITINIIFNLIKNSISKALKLQMLTVPGGNQMKPYRCVILWSYICIIENECWLYLSFLLLFKPGGSGCYI